MLVIVLRKPFGILRSVDGQEGNGRTIFGVFARVLRAGCFARVLRIGWGSPVGLVRAVGLVGAGVVCLGVFCGVGFPPVRAVGSLCDVGVGVPTRRPTAMSLRGDPRPRRPDRRVR